MFLLLLVVAAVAGSVYTKNIFSIHPTVICIAHLQQHYTHGWMDERVRARMHEFNQNPRQ